ncbi:hypothetical protein D018_2032B, partial [Vibrio parahaemolyticus VP2007-007]
NKVKTLTLSPLNWRLC